VIAPKLMVFELDGATWDVMNGLLEKGELPNIEKIMNRGVHGVLMSDPPTISPRVWTSIFSGKRPEKHGIDFFGANTKMLRSKRIWDILQDDGYKVGTFGTLVTWPPTPVNGFMIPSVCALGTETYPAEYSFFQEIVLSERKKFKNTTGPILALRDLFDIGLKLKRNGISLGTIFDSVTYLLNEKISRYDLFDRYYRILFLHLKLSAEFLIHLLRTFEPDFCTFHIHTCDSLAHRYWAFYEPEKFGDKITPEMIERFKNVIPDSYRESDKAIGKLLPLMAEDTHVIVVSDHGGQALPEAINPYTARLERLLEILGIADKVLVAIFGPGVNLNFKEKDTELMERTAKNLSEAYLEQTGDKIFYIKSFDNTLVVTKPNWRVKVEDVTEESSISFGELGSYRVKDLFTKQVMQRSGSHADEGIIIIAGPHIKKGFEMTQTSIYDMTPTMLTILGIPVAKDLDGAVMDQAFEPSYLEELRRIGDQTVETYEDGSYAPVEDEKIDREKLKRRLQQLGYRIQ